MDDAESITDSLAAGREALARGAWAEARQRVEAALRDAESGEGWEGLGWAGYWLHDADVTLRCREAPISPTAPLVTPAGRAGWRPGSLPTFTSSSDTTRSPAAGSSARTAFWTSFRRVPIRAGSASSRGPSSFAAPTARCSPVAQAARDAFTALGATREAARAEGPLLDDTTRGSSDVLTPRETEVLSLVAHGLTNAEIAERLVLSPDTLHRHVVNARAKLRQPSRAAAVAYASRIGLL